MMIRKRIMILCALFILFAFSSCTVTNTVSDLSEPSSSEETASEDSGSSGRKDQGDSDSSESQSSGEGETEMGTLFTDRDLEQTADLTDAQTIVLTDGEDASITEAGTYVIQGSAKNVTVRIDAGDEEKVQIVLDGVSIENENAPCIYVLNADKVFVTTVPETENTLSVTGAFAADGDVNTDAVIFSRDDLVLNGLGTLEIHSAENGIASKDDLKITGGTYKIDCVCDGLEANETVAIANGTVEITSEKDGIHAENDEDDTTGAAYIIDGNLIINAQDDGIHATTVIQIEGGVIEISAAEAIEATIVRINGGEIEINAGDDGINAAQKSSVGTPCIEINDGDIKISMGQGDTDAIDSNGDIIINGGRIDITAQSPFDYDGQGRLNGGTVIVNGSQILQLSNQMMAGGMMPGSPIDGPLQDDGNAPDFGQEPGRRNGSNWGRQG